jgi:hypothetical protein
MVDLRHTGSLGGRVDRMTLRGLFNRMVPITIEQHMMHMVYIRKLRYLYWKTGHRSSQICACPLSPTMDDCTNISGPGILLVCSL